MNILIYGKSGSMGQVLSSIISADDSLHEADVQMQPDVIIDLSSPQALDEVLNLAIAKSCPLVIATTGYTEQQLADIQLASKKIPVFQSSNFSIGIYLMQKALDTLLSRMKQPYDVHLIDIHHNKKKDAPSGTAKMLASGMSAHKPLDEIQTVSLRSGSVVGEHQVSIQWNQESLTLTHQAQSKEVFAFGAIAAAQFLVQQPIGYYTMDDLF